MRKQNHYCNMEWTKLFVQIFILQIHQKRKRKVEKIEIRIDD